MTHDMTFVAILLSSLYGLLEGKGTRRCIPHPIKAHPYICTAFLPTLTMMMAKCMQEFDKLPITQDRGILLNILYTGVWQNDQKRNHGGKQPADG